METMDTQLYRKAFIQYLRKGTPIERTLQVLLTKAEHPTTHYIWRTQGDDKVRPSHAANNGKIFAWNNPPDTGHPSEDFGCRCWAEPYKKDKSEYAYQTLTNAVNDESPAWTNYDLTRHYYIGGGRGVTLSEIGHLQGVMNYYFYTLGKYNDVNAQIIDAARSHPSGEFAYDFTNSYEFRGYLFVFGGGVVSGVFIGSVDHHDGMMKIEGNISYFYDDVFTDPLDLREIYSKNPHPEDMWWIERITEIGGSYFPVKDYWKTTFTAQAKLDEETSIYQW